MDRDEAYWRDTARRIRFFMFDARAAIPFIFTLLHLRWWTVGLAFVSFIVFGMLERWGYTIEVALRMLRSWAAGPVRSAVPWWEKTNRRN